MVFDAFLGGWRSPEGVMALKKKGLEEMACVWHHGCYTYQFRFLHAKAYVEWKIGS